MTPCARFFVTAVLMISVCTIPINAQSCSFHSTCLSTYYCRNGFCSSCSLLSCTEFNSIDGDCERCDRVLATTTTTNYNYYPSPTETDDDDESNGGLIALYIIIIIVALLGNLYCFVKYPEFYRNNNICCYVCMEEGNNNQNSNVNGNGANNNSSNGNEKKSANPRVVVVNDKPSRSAAGAARPSKGAKSKGSRPPKDMDVQHEFENQLKVEIIRLKAELEVLQLQKDPPIAEMNKLEAKIARKENLLSQHMVAKISKVEKKPEPEDSLEGSLTRQEKFDTPPPYSEFDIETTKS